MKNLILFIALPFFDLNERSAPPEINDISVSLLNEDIMLCRATASGLTWDLSAGGYCVTPYDYRFSLFGNSCNTSYCLTIISGGTLNSSSCKNATNGNVSGSSAWNITATGTEALHILVDIIGQNNTRTMTDIIIPKCGPGQP